jgi:serine O-acetyltransferase
MRSLSFLAELKADFRANGWRNGNVVTLLRMLVLSMNMHLLILYRLQVRIYRLPLIGKTLCRIVGYVATAITSSDISPAARIAGGLALPHPHGIQIGKGVVVGEGVTLYHNVTLGTKQGEPQPACPVIGAGATIFTGAVIIGGITIGERAIIGANAVVMKDVPEGKTAVGNPARIL